MTSSWFCTAVICLLLDPNVGLEVASTKGAGWSTRAKEAAAVAAEKAADALEAKVESMQAEKAADALEAKVESVQQDEQATQEADDAQLSHEDEVQAEKQADALLSLLSSGHPDKQDEGSKMLDAEAAQADKNHPKHAYDLVSDAMAESAKDATDDAISKTSADMIAHPDQPADAQPSQESDAEAQDTQSGPEFYNANVGKFICADHEDHRDQCPEWAEEGMCEKDPDIMHDWCKKSCGLCPDCHDEVKECTHFFQDTGKGATCSDAVINICRSTCGKCDKGTIQKKQGTASLKREHMNHKEMKRILNAQFPPGQDLSTTTEDPASAGAPKELKKKSEAEQNSEVEKEVKKDSDAQVDQQSQKAVEEKPDTPKEPKQETEEAPQIPKLAFHLHAKSENATATKVKQAEVDNEDSTYFWSIVSLAAILIVGLVIHKNITYDDHYGGPKGESLFEFELNGFRKNEYSGEDFRHMELGLSKDRYSWKGMMGGPAPLHEARDLMGFANMG